MKTVVALLCKNFKMTDKNCQTLTENAINFECLDSRYFLPFSKI